MTTNYDSNQWSKNPITIDIRCTNGAENGDTCTCAGVTENLTGPMDSKWSIKPYGNLTDANTFTRTFSDGRHQTTLYTADNAGNRSNPLSVNIGIDSTPPSVIVTKRPSD